MMTPQKVTLRGTEADPDAEVELGPFTQGVLVDVGALGTEGQRHLRDVATGRTIATGMRQGWLNVRDGSKSYYRQAFVQTYPEESS